MGIRLLFGICSAGICLLIGLHPFCVCAMYGAVLAMYMLENWSLLKDLKENGSPAYSEMHQTNCVQLEMIHKLTKEVLRLEKLTEKQSRQIREGACQKRPPPYYEKKWHEIKEDKAISFPSFQVHLGT